MGRAWWCIHVFETLRRLSQDSLGEFEDSLGYIVSNTVSKNKNKKKKKVRRIVIVFLSSR